MTKQSTPKTVRARRVVRAEPVAQKSAPAASPVAEVAKVPEVRTIEKSLTQAVQDLAREDGRIQTLGMEDKVSIQQLDASFFSGQDLAMGITSGKILTVVMADGTIMRWAILTVNGSYHISGNPALTAAPKKDISTIGIEVAVRNAKYNLVQRQGRINQSQAMLQGTSR